MQVLVFVMNVSYYKLDTCMIIEHKGQYSLVPL